MAYKVETKSISWKEGLFIAPLTFLPRVLVHKTRYLWYSPFKETTEKRLGTIATKTIRGGLMLFHLGVRIPAIIGIGTPAVLGVYEATVSNFYRFNHGSKYPEMINTFNNNLFSETLLFAERISTNFPVIGNINKAIENFTGFHPIVTPVYVNNLVVKILTSLEHQLESNIGNTFMGVDIANGINTALEYARNVTYFDKNFIATVALSLIVIPILSQRPKRTKIIRSTNRASTAPSATVRNPSPNLNLTPDTNTQPSPSASVSEFKKDFNTIFKGSLNLSEEEKNQSALDFWNKHNAGIINGTIASQEAKEIATELHNIVSDSKIRQQLREILTSI